MDLSWNPSLAVGVADIDEQHQEIFLRVADMMEATRQNRGSASLTLLVEFLVRYVEQHFASEEKLMKQHSYPDMEAHLAEHAKFRATFAALRGQHANNGATASLVLDISELTVDWLTAHIAKTDLALAAYLKPLING